PEKATEQSRDFYRFELTVPAGKSVKHEVVEEQSVSDLTSLSAADEKDTVVKLFLNSTVSSPKVKDALRKAVDLRHKLHGTQSERAAVEKQLKDITEEQGRLRANLDKVPPTSAVYKRYLEKFDTQETEIEKLQVQIKQLVAKEKEEKKEFEDYLA